MLLNLVCSVRLGHGEHRLMTLITGMIIKYGKVVGVRVPDLACIFHLAQQGARRMIILVKSLGHLPWTHPFGKLLGEQVNYLLALPAAFELLSASHQGPHGRD